MRSDAASILGLAMLIAVWSVLCAGPGLMIVLSPEVPCDCDR